MRKSNLFIKFNKTKGTSNTHLTSYHLIKITIKQTQTNYKTENNPLHESK